MNDIILDIKGVLNVFSNKSKEDILKVLKLNNCYELKQIHSDIIHIVDSDYINCTEGDTLITNNLNTPMIIKVADCIPILIYDKENKVLALVHSGWKGTLNNITIKTINKMTEKFNSNIENLSIYIYPSIRKCHFEVEYDVYSLFTDKFSNIDKYTIKNNNKYNIDMHSIIKEELNNIGINNITDTNICTYCNNNIYHSYRYNHTDKRNILLAMIKE